MRGLNAAQMKAWEGVQERVQEAEHALRVEIENFQQHMQEEWEERIDPKVQDIQAATEAAQQLIFSFQEEMDAYFENRSESWQEGDRGSAFSDWRSEWEVDVPMLDLDDLEAPQTPDLDGYQLPSQFLESLPISIE